MKNLLGIDIGGTKCAVSLAGYQDGEINIIERKFMLTPATPEETISQIIEMGQNLSEKYNVEQISSIGISCGGPLDSKRGLILSPPNLPGWDNINIVEQLKEVFKTEVFLQNDANACALAEWKWGAGKGKRNIIFLTFGTGMGAGLILNGQLYSGTNDLAGEVGHIRLEEEGPVGYGKAGSFEGFCSGGGIAKLAQTITYQEIKRGNIPTFCDSLENVSSITAKDVGIAAQNGDELALQIYKIVGEKLGKALAIFIDLLNPERIIIGSIYGRQHDILEPVVLETVKKESLPISLNVCDIVPADLGESIGDYASFSVALQGIE